MSGKSAYESSIRFNVAWVKGTLERPWEALTPDEKQRWEEIAFEQEQKERKDAA